MSDARSFVRALAAGGIRTYFGVPGVDTLPLYAALEDEGISSIVVRHEATAGYAADAYFRVTGQPAACLTTGGPGAANTAAAMGEAWASGSTFLHITTAVPTSDGASLPPRGLPHYHPRQAEQFEGIARWAVRCDDPGQLDEVARLALEETARPPHAPVLAEIPIDVLEGGTGAGGSGAGIPTTAPVLPTDVPMDRLDEAAAMLDAARAPVIWAGSGSLGAADDIVALAEALSAPIVLTYSARRRFRIDHPLVVTFPPHEPAVADLLGQADVLLALGTDLDAMMTRSGRLELPASLIHVDIEPRHVGMSYPARLRLSGAVEDVVPALRTRLAGGPGRTDDGRAAEARRRAWADQAEGGFAPARRFLERLDAAIPDDAVIVCDMTVAGYWAAGYLDLRPRRQLLYPMGWGTLGFGLPAAIGAAVAAEGRRVVCIVGDAGLLYAVGELATVAEHDLPITSIVVDDGGYGMLRFAGPARFGREFDMDLRSPDLPALAGAFGIDAERTDLHGDGAADALRDAVAADGPTLLALEGRLEPPRMSRLWE